MEYLLDSHILLWSIFQPEKLSPKVTEILINLDYKIYISSVTLWEITLKYQIGKMNITGFDISDIYKILEEQDYEVLSLKAIDTKNIIKLPFIENHKDPFDRMIISQAINNNLVLISKDNKFQEYKKLGLELVS